MNSVPCHCLLTSMPIEVWLKLPKHFWSLSSKFEQNKDLPGTYQVQVSRTRDLKLI